MSVVPDLVPPHLRPGAPAERDQPVITGLGLSLRPWQPSDAPLLVRAYSVPDIRHWHGRSMEDGEGEAWICERAARWRAEAGADWAVAADRQVQGRAGLRWISLADGSAEVSYWVLPEARRRQVATRALIVLSRWALRELGLHRLELLHSTANPASCRVAELAGYAFEGVKRHEARHSDGWHNMHLHARLASDPDPAGSVAA
jgi:RimJ/RimL family protein N-acetyltransferase